MNTPRSLSEVHSLKPFTSDAPLLRRGSRYWRRCNCLRPRRMATERRAIVGSAPGAPALSLPAAAPDQRANDPPDRAYEPRWPARASATVKRLRPEPLFIGSAHVAVSDTGPPSSRGPIAP